MGTVTFGKLLPGKVEAVHWSYSVSFFFPPQSAFRKLLPQQKRFAARSSEWLNNSGESDFSRTSLGLCLWSNTTQGLDTLKTLLRIWLCTQKRLVKKWLWQKASVNDGPRVHSQALNVCCEKLLTVKAADEKALKFSQGFTVRYILLKVLSLSQSLLIALWQTFQDWNA